MGGVVKNFGQSLGESLGILKPKAEEVSPEYGQELFQQGLEAFKNVGQDPASQRQRDLINQALESQLGQLDNNAAGRKQMFQEDMSRQFAGDTQNLARARGGTGTLASALRPSGQMYDAQARQTARGLNDLYGQAMNDLSSASNIRSGMQQQDLQRAQGMSGVFTGEAKARRDQANTNADARWNSAGVQRAAQSKQQENAMKMFGMAKGG